MNNDHNPVVLTEEDYNLLKPYLNYSGAQPEEMSLAHELKRAIIVSKPAFPPHTIRLNSKVTIIDKVSSKEIRFSIVLPEESDIKTNQISVLAPMGAAFIGFRKGEEVVWKVPGGMKTFIIKEVDNT